MERISLRSAGTARRHRNRRLWWMEQAQDLVWRRSIRRAGRFATRSRVRRGEDSSILRTSEVGAAGDWRNDSPSLRECRARGGIHPPGDGCHLEWSGVLSSEGICSDRESGGSLGQRAVPADCKNGEGIRVVDSLHSSISIFSSAICAPRSRSFPSARC